MVTIIRGEGSQNAISKVGDELLRNLQIQHKVKYADKSPHVSWFTNYHDNIIHSLFPMNSPILKYSSKVITTVYDMIPLIHPELLSPVVRFQYTLAYRNLQKADKIIAISNFTKNEIIRLLGIEEHKIQVIYLGVRHDMFNDTVKRDTAIRLLGLNPKHRYIACVSNVAPNKNLQILDKLEKVLPEDVKILKAGYGSSWGSSPRIVNLGLLSDKEMPLLYRASLCSLHPTLYEGFGLAILEACACGIPTVAFNNPTQKEITTSGVVHSEEEFINRVQFLIDIPQENIFGKMDAERFSWAKMAREYEEVYKKLETQ